LPVTRHLSPVTALRDVALFLFVFEFLGTTELLVIALVALIIFGPRKLPELGRSLGKSLGEFKRATEDFKQTWEREVEVEKFERELRMEQEVGSARAALSGEASAVVVTDEGGLDTAGPDAATQQTIARGTATTTAPDDSAAPAVAADLPEPSRKQDWL
ncbi:MAG: twin-arginine translocase TatA/TatE family subunit, partial [Pyrinomonadaceae bacterium]